MDADDVAVGDDQDDTLEQSDLGRKTAGEVGVSPSEPFSVSKKAAAVLKHGILARYVKPWAAKVGSTSEAGRVAYLDGYAGPGMYAASTDDSPKLVLDAAKSEVFSVVRW